MTTERKSIAILDANAFISMSSIINLAATARLVTTSDVLAELKDIKTKQFVDNLPYEIQIVDCDDKDLQIVKQFSIKTGDIATLSKVDMELISVAYMLYKKEGLEGMIRKSPPPILEKTDLQEFAGQDELSSSSEEQQEDETKPLEIVQKPSEQQIDEKLPLTEQKKEQPINTIKSTQEQEQGQDWISVPVKPKRKVSSSSSEQDDQSGWITTKNYEKKIAQITSSFKQQQEEKNEEEVFSIWIVSADFSLQNVAVQMGIKLMSLDGRKITSIRRFIYQCYLCWKKYRIHDQKVKLCNNCGYNSLSKIAYSIDSNGRMVLHRKRGWKPNKKILQVKERILAEQQRKKKHQHARRKKKPSIFEN